VKSLEHIFFNYPLPQQCVALPTNIMWQLLAKNSNLGPQKSYSMVQCLFDQPLCKITKLFNHIWFFLRSGHPWILWHQPNDLVFNAPQWQVEKTHQAVWDTLLDYGRIEWKQIVTDLEKPRKVLIKMLIRNLIRCGVSKVLL
jgi:hypothetical protein